jgi:hypothetical protein
MTYRPTRSLSAIHAAQCAPLKNNGLIALFFAAFNVRLKGKTTLL